MRKWFRAIAAEGVEEPTWKRSAERHPWRWGIGGSVTVGLLYGILYRSVLGGVLMGLCIGVVILAGEAVTRLARRRT